MNFGKQHVSFTVNHILNLRESGKLNLNPGFQRESVWTDKDRKALIDTILRGMPLPNLFLWEHKEGNKIVYDVIDGKQRIESLLAFTRKIGALSVEFDPEGDTEWVWSEPYEWSWKEIQASEKSISKRFLAYEFPIVIVRGSLPDVEKVFIRINSTGKKLSRQEIRHAQWYNNSPLLQAAETIAKQKKYSNYFIQMGVLSQGQISRMKAIELITELMLTIEKEDVLDRKKSLDSVMGNQAIHASTLGRLEREVKSTLDLVKRTFPEIHTSRFKNTSDFYALFFAIWKMKRDGYTFANRKTNEMAFTVLNQLGLSLVDYKESFKRGKPKQLQSPAKEYHSTVMEGTDTARHRRTRVSIIENILRPIFPLKDSKRLFTQEQKQLLWHSSKDKCCSNPKCKKVLSWLDVRMDHIQSYIKGGRTDLRNAQILCSSCNSIKGGK